MGSQGVDLKFLVVTLRRVTTAVQILPFIYTALYIFALALYTACGPRLQTALDSLFYVSPVCILAFLVLSHVLKLCRWHKTACLLPALPQTVSLIDYYLSPFSNAAAYLFNCTIILMSILLLIAAYFVFFK
jgi:hypothetical protein